MYINKFNKQLVEAYKWVPGAKDLPAWINDATETQDYRYGTPVLQYKALPTIKRLAREGEYLYKDRKGKHVDTMSADRFEKHFEVATEEQIKEIDLAEERATAANGIETPMAQVEPPMPIA